jgi:hypothetical protein
MRVLSLIWHKAGALSLTIWLLFFTSLMMAINSHLALGDRSQLYHNLNTTSIRQWLGEVYSRDFTVFAAMAFLLFALGTLSLNTFACTVNRLAELARSKGKKMARARTFQLWAPTLMHILFFLVLGGHMATFTFGDWRQYTVKSGDRIPYSPDMAPVSVENFSRRVYQNEGPLKGGVIFHELQAGIDGRRHTIRELQPLRLPNGDWLLLLSPQKNGKSKRRQAEEPVDCSGEERHLSPPPFNPAQDIQLKQVSDPGIYFLFTGFGLILVIMGTYYALSWRNNIKF